MTLRKEIVDNETDRYSMANFLNDALARNKSSLDIASGFFNVGGFGLVKDSLWQAAKQKTFSIRLLYGREAITEGNQHDEEIPLPEELGDLAITEESAKLVDNLISFLKLENVQIRNNPQRFNHAKCYIFDEAVVVGSSNFTRAGLTRNMELNAVLYQPSAQDLVREWFNRRWNEGSDAKVELIQLLEESKFGKPLEPFFMYMKFLYEYYKPRLQELESAAKGRLELASFQEDAVTTAMRIIKTFKGVIVADSTGLGKTHIGMEVLRELVAVQRKKALLLAPKQVIDTVWEPRLLDASIKTKNVSVEFTGTSNFRPEEFLDYDVVLIDESHNYRNPSTNRRLNLMKLLSGGKRKQVILQTATPVNNSLMDLYHQVSLITAGDDAYFARLDIPDLRHHFLSADKKRLASGIEDIVSLLDTIMIRRTRQFIKENYPDATINKRPVTFPTRHLKKVEYTLTQIFGTTVYKQLLDTIDQLTLAPYRVKTYLKEVEEKEREEVEYRAELQRYGLLKRFESSVAAIRESVRRLIEFYEFFEKALSKGKILSSQSFHRILVELEDEEEDNDEAILRRMEAVDLEPLGDRYNVSRMKRDLTMDLNLLRPLLKGLTNIHPYSDRKLTRLKELFDEDHIFEQGGRRVVIFTQFVDTARYIRDELDKDLKDHKVRLLTGESDREQRKRTLEAFAPKANNAPPGTQEVDILISTDVLSEGQNLQDANYCINYDLPWNPMKIVQRVGRVDRLMSDYAEVTAAVFLPEKELEDILHLLEKLQTKIQKVTEVVGTEATILGEKENPKNFNALHRIGLSDQTLIDEMERSSELLPAVTPFQFILSYLRKVGKEKLETIPMGKRSGKSDNEVNGVVVFYKEKKNPEGIHLLFYDYDRGKLDHINDVSWIFRKVACREEESLKIPLQGFDIFRHFAHIDDVARNEVVKYINAPLDATEGLKIKPRNQRELVQTILALFRQGKLPKDKTQPVYETLLNQNLIAWEDEFGAFLADYRSTKNAEALLASVDSLFERYKIGARKLEERRELHTDDLTVVGYMFLSRPGEVFPMLS